MKITIPDARRGRGKSYWSPTSVQIQPSEPLGIQLLGWIWASVRLQHDFPRSPSESGIIFFMKTILKNNFPSLPIEQNRSEGHQRRARAVDGEKII